jgi:hypothetical protein
MGIAIIAAARPQQHKPPRTRSASFATPSMSLHPTINIPNDIKTVPRLITVRLGSLAVNKNIVGDAVA